MNKVGKVPASKYQCRGVPAWNALGAYRGAGWEDGVRRVFKAKVCDKVWNLSASRVEEVVLTDGNDRTGDIGPILAVEIEPRPECAASCSACVAWDMLCVLRQWVTKPLQQGPGERYGRLQLARFAGALQSLWTCVC